MNRQALSFRRKLFKCLDCKEYLDGGGFGTGPLGKTHFGCGGPVITRRQDIDSGTYLQSLQRSGNSEAVSTTPSLPPALGVVEYKAG